MNNYKEKVVSEIERITLKTGIRELLEMGLTTIQDLQKWLVKELYFEARKKGDKTCKEIKYILSDEYAMSISQIEKLVYRG